MQCDIRFTRYDSIWQFVNWMLHLDITHVWMLWHLYEHGIFNAKYIYFKMLKFSEIIYFKLQKVVKENIEYSWFFFWKSKFKNG
jgi:hypothetical protein